MKKINHMMEINKYFIQINTAIVDLRKKIEAESKIKFESQDARHVALDSIQQEMFACKMWISTLNSLKNKFTDRSNNKFNEKEFLGSIDSPLELKETEKLMLYHLRLGFLVLVHFRIDNLFQNILKKIKVTPRRGYWHLCEALLKSISVTQKKDKMDKLIILSYLRNSLHNNGIHGGNPLTKTIKGLKYSFVDGDVVRCASWDHIIVALSANIDVLSEILLCNKIKSLNYMIEDKFSASINPN